MPSDLEDALLTQIQDHGLPEPKREYRFHPVRRWRFDFAWPDRKIACEVDGATWARGRHVRGYGVDNDCEKYAEATFLGWRVFRVTGPMIKKGTKAIDILTRAFDGLSVA